MTITTNDDRDEYTATSGQTVFSYTFKIYASTDLNVYQTPSGSDFNDSTDLITAYTVADVGESAGGTITLDTGATTGDRITIVSGIPSSRTTDYQVSGDFKAPVVNEDIDRVISLQKQAEGIARRALLFPQSQQGTAGLTLPKPTSGLFMRWKDDLSGLENVDLSVLAAQAVLPVLQPRQIGDGSTVTFNTPSSVSANPVSFSVNLSGVYQRPNTDYLINSLGQVVFTVAPPDGVEVDITYFEPSISASVASSVSLTIDGTGTDVSAYLNNEFTNTDYESNIRYQGALPDTSDSNAAITAAAATGLTIHIPDGDYRSTFTSRIKYTGTGRMYEMDGATVAENFIKIAGGDTDKDVAPMSCVIRQDNVGTGWYFIDDSGHEPNGFNGVAIDGADDYSLILDHKRTIAKIGATVATGDEWYAKAGVSFGTSVSSGLTKIFAHKDAVFTVGNATQTVVANGFFGSTITAVKNGDYTITVTHPTVLSGSDEAIVCAGSGTAGGAVQVPVLIACTATTTQYAMYAPLSGYLYHDGASWLISTNSAIAIGIAADSTGITLTHTNLLEGLSFVSARDGAYLAHMDTNNPTTSRIVFRDYAGAVVDPTVSPTSKRCYFMSGEFVQQKDTIGQTKIIRQNVAVKWDNLYGSTGNVWVVGSNSY